MSRSPRLSLRFLGRFSVAREDHVPIALPPAVRQLFALLAFHSGRPFSRERVLECFWRHTYPCRARNCLASALCRLRQALAVGGVDPENLAADRETIVLRREVVAWSDVGEVLAIHSDGRECDAAAIERTMPLFRGALLEDQDAEWIQPERRRFEAIRRHWTAALVSRWRAQGRFDDCVGLIEQQLALDPLDERLYRELISLHRARGAMARSIEAYERCRVVLREELGVGPSPETVALVAQRTTAKELPASAADASIVRLAAELDEIGALIRQLRERVLGAVERR